MREEKLISARRRLLRYCALVFSIFCGFFAYAPQACPASPDPAVRIQVVIVHASHSDGGFDKRLNFARKNLLAYGYKNYTYAWSRTFSLAQGRTEKFSVAPGISALIELKGVIEESDRVQYSLTIYNRKKRQAGAIYTIPRKGMGIAVVPQSGGRAYIIIVRPLK